MRKKVSQRSLLPLATRAFAVLALAGCSTKSAPIETHIGGNRAAHAAYNTGGSSASSKRQRAQSAASRAVFDAAETLQLCPGAPARHTGSIGQGGEVMVFTPIIHVKGLTLLRNPTDGACLTSAYGWRPRATGGGRNHRGLDYARPRTKKIVAAGDGTVISSGFLGGYGLAVILDHGNGVETLYGHLDPSEPPVRKGEAVRAGQRIGKMGTTGQSSGIHLHYEVIIDGAKYDPLRVGMPSGLIGFM
jgi:murein DD-endopeptidase MepM/ murein hydrolase activator NlpD